MILVAFYDTGGRFLKLLCPSVGGITVGASVVFTLPVDNTSGAIAQIKAFPIASLAAPTPVGAAVSFPAQ